MAFFVFASNFGIVGASLSISTGFCAGILADYTLLLAEKTLAKKISTLSPTTSGSFGFRFKRFCRFW